MRKNLLFLISFILYSSTLFANERRVDLTKFDGIVTYYGLYQANKKIGYAKFSSEITYKKGFKEFVQNSFLHMQYGIGVASEEIEVFELLDAYSFDISSRRLISYSYTENINYFINRDDLNKNIIKKVESGSLFAELADDLQYEITEVVGDEETSRVSELPVLLVDNYFMDEYFVLNDPDLGDTIQAEVYDLDFFDSKIISAKTTLSSVESYKNKGSEFKHYILEHTAGYSPEITISKFDAFGIPIVVDHGALKFKLEPKNIAMDINIDKHITTLGEMPIDNFITSDETVEEIYLELIGYDLKSRFIENERQKIIEEKNGKMLVKLSKGGLITGQKEEIDSELFLRDTPKFNWKNENLRLINPYEDMLGLNEIDKVKFLIEFTYDYLDYKFTLGATLDEVIKNKVGDCTEYAQLFVALARLNNIPAREVGGFAYGYDEPESSFYGHAWAEVWIDNKWVEVDPGWNEFDVDASHLRLSNSFDYGLGNQIKLISYK